MFRPIAIRIGTFIRRLLLLDKLTCLRPYALFVDSQLGDPLHFIPSSPGVERAGEPQVGIGTGSVSQLLHFRAAMPNRLHPPDIHPRSAPTTTYRPAGGLSSESKYPRRLP